jgi:hypothetical protein
MLVDHKNKRVYDLMEGRSKTEVEEGLKKLKGCHNVRQVTLVPIRVSSDPGMRMGGSIHARTGTWIFPPPIVLSPGRGSPMMISLRIDSTYKDYSRRK